MAPTSRRGRGRPAAGHVRRSVGCDGVPDHAVPARPPIRRADASDRPSRPAPGRRRVLFDFHGTLAQVEDPVDLGARGGRRLRRRAGPGAGRPSLADRLVTAGRAGGPLPARVPPHLAEVWADRDLYRARAPGRVHRAGRDRATPASTGCAEALYERLLRRRGLAGRTPTPRRRCRRCTAAGVPVGGGQQHRLRHPAALRRARAWPTTSTRTCCRTRSAAASRTRRSSSTPARALRVDPERDADGRRHARPTPARSRPAAGVPGAPAGRPGAAQRPAAVSRSLATRRSTDRRRRGRAELSRGAVAAEPR